MIKTTIAEIENRFPFVVLTAGLSNLAKSTQIAYKAERQRRINAIRAHVKQTGDWPSYKEALQF